jgi:hypothetical protein
VAERWVAVTRSQWQARSTNIIHNMLEKSFAVPMCGCAALATKFFYQCRALRPSQVSCHSWPSEGQCQAGECARHAVSACSNSKNSNHKGKAPLAMEQQYCTSQSITVPVQPICGRQAKLPKHMPPKHLTRVQQQSHQVINRLITHANIGHHWPFS